MFHTAGWYESIDNGAAYGYIAGIPDDSINVNGDNIRVSSQLPNVGAVAVLSATTTLTAARLEAPSLTQLTNLYINPMVNAAVFGSLPPMMNMARNPRPMSPSEYLRLAINSDNAGAVAHYGLVWFTDAALPQVDGEIFTVRATAANTLVAGSWVGGNITFDQQLPSGSYDVVGMRAVGANLVCARLVFTGDGASGWRPGVPAVNAVGNNDAMMFRFGGMGVWGTFDQDNPPTIETLGVTDTSQVLFLDLIKRG